MSEDLQALYEVAFQHEGGVSDEIIQKFGRKFADGQMVFDDGDSGDELFIIIEGEVEIVKNIKDEEKIFAVLGNDAIFGEMAVFDPSPRSAGARAKGDLTTLVFNRDNFEIIFQLHPKWTMMLIEGLATRLVQAYKNLASKLTD